ncbi:hypothetical protein E2C01_047374 [Portunus trituberculatus]|uniref:Uncharacterized protein n=1 Tax=Portunus trituberculatus TaxID=210409 RepID=A0A5B7G089_PORTR|nr:hypothetical protein [Portunus trituberculatus]
MQTSICLENETESKGHVPPLFPTASSHPAAVDSYYSFAPSHGAFFPIFWQYSYGKDYKLVAGSPDVLLPEGWRGSNNVPLKWSNDAERAKVLSNSALSLCPASHFYLAFHLYGYG